MTTVRTSGPRVGRSWVGGRVGYRWAALGPRSGHRSHPAAALVRQPGTLGARGLVGAQVGDELLDLLVGQGAAIVETPRRHVGARHAARDEGVDLLVGGAREELL